MPQKSRILIKAQGHSLPIKQPIIVGLPCPSARLLSKRPRRVECHVGRKSLHRDRGGIEGHVRIGGFVITAIPLQLVSPRIPPSKRGCPV
jgi:hypothetical protein